MMKKILFVPIQPSSICVGTYRIWIKDYCSYLNKVGALAKISNEDNYRIRVLSDDEIEENDIFILGKPGCELTRKRIHKQFPNKVVGAITPDGNGSHSSYDFVMAGSMEEADSLSSCENVIVNAHIESLFYNENPKIHEPKKTLNICIHGWTAHLASLEPNLKPALEEFEKENNFELTIICERDAGFAWEKGRPNIKHIIVKKWDHQTIKTEIKKCDIGLVPGITDLSQYVKEYGVHPRSGLFKTDHMFRVKNKCNNGRALVFHQLGIPVIADFTPSNMHIIGSGDCGFLANSVEGWLRALRKLKDVEIRKEISQNAYQKTKIEYNPLIWAKKYNDSLQKIYNDKQ